jgi:hypothetical protein
LQNKRSSYGTQKAIHGGRGMIFSIIGLVASTSVYTMACLKDVGWLAIICMIFNTIFSITTLLEYQKIDDRISKLEKESEDNK